MRFARQVPLIYALAQHFVWFLFRIGTRLQITGQDNVPLTGPLIIAPNHLHALDIPVIGVVIPRRIVVFAADKWRGSPGGFIMERVTRVIYVARGEADRAAMNEAHEVLRDGGCMAVAPEGTRSRTGGLQKGKHGAVYLACRMNTPIVPVIMWGQEQILPQVLRLRRAAVHVVICAPWYPPPGADRARTAQLEAYTDELMMILARGLPPQYRGAYADRVIAERPAAPQKEPARS
jgi:1-acyl-sn-glycerol-3-phosphate acyltransferase